MPDNPDQDLGAATEAFDAVAPMDPTADSVFDQMANMAGVSAPAYGVKVEPVEDTVTPASEGVPVADETPAAATPAPEPLPEHLTPEAAYASAKHWQSEHDKLKGSLEAQTAQPTQSSSEADLLKSILSNPALISALSGKKEPEAPVAVAPVPPEKPSGDDPFEHADYLERVTAYNREYLDFQTAQMSKTTSSRFEQLEAKLAAYEQKEMRAEQVSAVESRAQALGLSPVESKEFSQMIIDGAFIDNEQAWIHAYRAMKGVPATPQTPTGPTAQEVRAAQQNRQPSLAINANGSQPVKPSQFQDQFMEFAESRSSKQSF